MKIHCAGAEGYTNQIQRIREGFQELNTLLNLVKLMLLKI